MIILIITGVLILLTILGIVLYGIFGDHDGGAWWFLFVSPIWLVIIPLANIKVIKANEVGVVYHQLKGGIQEDTYDEGLHMKSVFEKVTTISTVNREIGLTTTGQTSDGQYVEFEISLIYRIDAADAGKFFKKTGATDISKDAMNTLTKKTLQKRNYQLYNL